MVADTDKAAGEPISPIAGPIAGTAAQATVAGAQSPDTPAPTAAFEALDPVAEKSQSSDAVPTPEASAKAAPLATVGLAAAEAKTLPRALSQAENPQAGAPKAGATTIEKAGKSDETSPPDAKRPAPQQAVEEAHAGAAGQADTKIPGPHQPHGQPSDHAAATARVAFTAAHGGLSAPASVAQSVTAQPGSTPFALGVSLAAPLASPLQSLWQAPPQPAGSSDVAVPIAGVAVEIVSRAQDGLRRFEIRLDPPELGRIDVRLDVDNGGNVTSRLTVERAETLDLLRRDAPQLERALQHAGLNTDGGLQFSLRDQNFANRDPAPRNAPTFIVPDDEQAAAEAAHRGYGRLLGLGGGIDIRV